MRTGEADKFLRSPSMVELHHGGWLYANIVDANSMQRERREEVLGRRMLVNFSRM